MDKIEAETHRWVTACYDLNSKRRLVKLPIILGYANRPSVEYNEHGELIGLTVVKQAVIQRPL